MTTAGRYVRGILQRRLLVRAGSGLPSAGECRPRRWGPSIGRGLPRARGATWCPVEVRYYLRDLDHLELT